MKKQAIILSLVLSCPFFINAQSWYSVDQVATLKIEGTSTLHDWEMESNKASGKAEFILEGNQIKEIKSLDITVPAESLKSGKSAMDKNAYKSLKTESHKDLRFNLTRVLKVEASGGKCIVTCEGNLNIAGKTKLVQLKADCLARENGRIQCIGTKSINMKEYDVEPPSFMFGSVRTGEEITIEFDVLFQKS